RPAGSAIIRSDRRRKSFPSCRSTCRIWGILSAGLFSSLLLGTEPRVGFYALAPRVLSTERFHIRSRFDWPDYRATGDRCPSRGNRISSARGVKAPPTAVRRRSSGQSDSPPYSTASPFLAGAV